jgi:DinB superfamily
MPASQPEPWLRGPLAGTPLLLQPPAHAFVMAREDTEAAASGLTREQLWMRPGGAASIGFHLAHLAGSTDRLLTYARGESLSPSQFSALHAEREVDIVRPPLNLLFEAWHATVDRAMRQIAGTPESSLLEPRTVGRSKLPSTVLGLIFHSAEHAQRHVGQIVTTAKIARAGWSA